MTHFSYVTEVAQARLLVEADKKLGQAGDLKTIPHSSLWSRYQERRKPRIEQVPSDDEFKETYRLLQIQ